MGWAGRGIAPDNAHFVDVYQAHDAPPAARLVDAADGRIVSEIGKADASRLDALGPRRAELFTFKAADDPTTLRGILQFPSRFDPARKYPVLVEVYGGPEFSAFTARETFVAPNPLAEYGFLIVSLDSRAVPGLGKRTLDAIYQKLGQAEIDDIAAGVKALWDRPYVDQGRAGIFGTSYGGYAAVMECCDRRSWPGQKSPPTDWRTTTPSTPSAHVIPGGRARRRQRDDVRRSRAAADLLRHSQTTIGPLRRLNFRCS